MLAHMTDRAWEGLGAMTMPTAEHISLLITASPNRFSGVVSNAAYNQAEGNTEHGRQGSHSCCYEGAYQSARRLNPETGVGTPLPIAASH